MNKLNPPAIILVNPQLGENIGMCARAMMNCGISELRIVSPRDGWPSDGAIRASAGADSILRDAKIFNSTKEAVADLEFVLATTARERNMMKEIFTPEKAAVKIRQINGGADHQSCAVMFGCERTGLENDDVCLANAILNVPLNPEFSSLNLAQAVLLVSYAWLSADNHFDGSYEHQTFQPASKDDISNLIERLEAELASSTFFRNETQKPTVLMNIRSMFNRIPFSRQDVKTFHGIINSLTGNKSK